MWADDAPKETDDPVPDADPWIAERCAWSLVWVGVMAGGLSTWGEWSTSPVLTILAPVLVAAAGAGIIAAWVSESPRSRNLQLLALAAVIASVVLSQYGSIHPRRFYATDSAAFDHVAAQTLLYGKDPYSVSTSAAHWMLDIPDRYWTYTATGGHVTDVSYPAGSFLLIAPALLLGFHHHVVDWMDLLAWLVTGGLMFALVPAALRWLAALLILTPLFVNTFSYGGTDALFLPFLMVALWRWDRYGRGRGAGVAAWIGPVALGLACAIKQSPWFCVPFLVAGVALEARRAGRPPLPSALRYGVTVLGVFAAVNLPFIVWGPSAWLHGTLTPFAQPLVADGQGLVSLATHGIVRGVDLTYLTVCGALVYLTVLGLFVTTYPRLKRVWLVVVPLAMFVSPRSLSSYLVDFIPVALLAAVTVAGTKTPRHRDRTDAVATDRRPSLRVALCAVPALGAVAAAVLAFMGPPLALTVLRVDTSAGGRTLTAITLSVHNLTDSPEVPHVTVTMGTHLNGYWLPRDGRMNPVPPHGEATVTLYPPIVTASAGPGVQWLVSAYTASPRALTTSALLVGPGPTHG
ncbi:MAG TPA: hypothetical protein VN816_04205 [Acidimicrobiales bacterium]|nr:hypothetical protein [Acidimicrobiales bacterium]